VSELWWGWPAPPLVRQTRIKMLLVVELAAPLLTRQTGGLATHTI